MHLLRFVFFETKGMRQWNTRVESAYVTLFWTHKRSVFFLEVKVCRHYRRGQNPTQPISVLQSQLYVINGAHFCVEIFLLPCLGMRYLSNCFKNDIIRNQLVGRISWLCGYYLLSENHSIPKQLFEIVLVTHTKTGIHSASRSVDTGVLSWGKSGLGMILTTHLHTQPR